MKKILEILLRIGETILENINICVFSVLIVLCTFFITKSCSQGIEIDRLSKNYYAISDSVEYFKTENDKNAAKTKQAELTLEEFKTTTNKDMARLNSVINDLNIKLKKVSGVTTGSTVIRVNDTVILREIVNEGKLSRTGIYTDNWTNIAFYVSEDTLEFDLTTRDTIDIITSKEKVGKFKLKNIFVKRPVIYTTTATMTRPNGFITVNSFSLK